MKIITPPDFFKTFKDSYFLLDTSVFIDSFLSPEEFGKFFDSLRSSGVTLLSLDVVKVEFLKGAQNAEKYKEKDDFFDQILDALLPVTGLTVKNLYKITKVYHAEGKGLPVTDIFLGATLMQYERSLFLLTKNTTDFPTNIFSLASHINIAYRRGLHSYGIYNIT